MAWILLLLEHKKKRRLLWHSHHNESGQDALILPIQDAGLHSYMRTLDQHYA